jgi:hypothetical protein
VMDLGPKQEVFTDLPGCRHRRTIVVIAEQGLMLLIRPVLADLCRLARPPNLFSPIIERYYLTLDSVRTGSLEINISRSWLGILIRAGEPCIRKHDLFVI